MLFSYALEDVASGVASSMDLETMLADGLQAASWMLNFQVRAGVAAAARLEPQPDWPQPANSARDAVTQKDAQAEQRSAGARFPGRLGARSGVARSALTRVLSCCDSILTEPAETEGRGEGDVPLPMHAGSGPTPLRGHKLQPTAPPGTEFQNRPNTAPSTRTQALSRPKQQGRAKQLRDGAPLPEAALERDEHPKAPLVSPRQVVLLVSTTGSCHHGSNAAEM